MNPLTDLPQISKLEYCKVLSILFLIVSPWLLNELIINQIITVSEY